jgi:hypothetical protein
MSGGTSHAPFALWNRLVNPVLKATRVEVTLDPL